MVFHSIVVDSSNSNVSILRTYLSTPKNMESSRLNIEPLDLSITKSVPEKQKVPTSYGGSKRRKLQQDQINSSTRDIANVNSAMLKSTRVSKYGYPAQLNQIPDIPKIPYKPGVRVVDGLTLCNISPGAEDH